MSADVAQILQVYASIGEQVMKDALDQVSATNKTVMSVRSEVISSETKDSLKIYARKYVELLEKGRGPTSKNPSPEMIQLLTEYAQARGMEKPESAAWAMAKKMNKEGDRTFRRGGRIVYSAELNKFVEELKAECTKVFKGSFLREVKNTWQQQSSNAQ